MHINIIILLLYSDIPDYYTQQCTFQPLTAQRRTREPEARARVLAPGMH
jgi:hypothetical protein